MLKTNVNHYCDVKTLFLENKIGHDLSAKSYILVVHQSWHFSIQVYTYRRLKNGIEENIAHRGLKRRRSTYNQNQNDLFSQIYTKKNNGFRSI